MRAFLLAVAMAALLVQPVPASARASDASPPSVFPSEHTRVRTETLWIFDADFEDLVGDNARWTTDDASGTPEYVNYWHKDTIRINGFAHLGDSTWWCGTYNDCWRQPRGYGNDWICILQRSFHELAYLTEPDDAITLEYDQRFAIEPCYDYGYADVSSDGGENWTTLTYVTDTHFGCSFGHSHDWDSTSLAGPGHQILDLSAYAGQVLDLRFRFESDPVGSSQDMYDNPWGAVRDGAWQLDNIAIYINDELYWMDDCESPGDNGWVRESIPASGVVGAVFERSYEEFDGHSGWMMAAYDTASGAVVDDQWALLFSPPIYVGDATALVASWEGWLDLPPSGDDYVAIHVSTESDQECLWQQGHYAYGPAWWLTSGGPEWGEFDDDWSEWVDNDWLGIRLWVKDTDAALNSHGKGFVLDRIRVGVPLETSVPDDEVFVNELRRVYPNPFSSATTIAYSLASAGHVTVRIHDAAGRVVRTLVDSEMAAGPRDVRWDGRTDAGDRAASGVYFVRMTVSDDDSGAGAREQKLVLLK